jgi:archaellum biogenesis protein FlaJ (TadC family)
MDRALTTRFVISLVLMSALVVALNLIDASPGLAVCSYFACMGTAIWLIGSCLFAHEDQIHPRAPRRHDRGS